MTSAAPLTPDSGPLPPLDPGRLPAALVDLAMLQQGAIGRAQVAALGVSHGVIRRELRVRRWRRRHPRTYVTFSGPLPFRARVWAAVLYAGAYARGVEKAHGLPGGVRNLPEGRAGRRRYRDVRYRRWRLVVELDGRAAHPEEDREHDDLRDNELVAQEGTRTLRYGWRSVVTRPCATAAQVAAVLGAGGWTGGE